MIDGNVGIMRNGRLLASWAIALAGASVIAGAVYPQLRAPLTTPEQVQTVITTGSTSVTVVVIPGFPLESLVVGSLLGLIILGIMRRHNSHRA